MSKIDMTTAFAYYLALALLFLLLTAWLGERRRNRRRPTPPERGLVQCEFCIHEYISAHSREISVCPQCHSLNDGRSTCQLSTGK